ncbi:hypothetical protein GCM10023144_10300 [Pigmentiphaga soli]|uniref:Gluconate 2-dehydrogenase n=1 Tax=Pigmentiphaga soli TaxID=1007095 RepID=A0ABP8GLR3_9BURK
MAHQASRHFFYLLPSEARFLDAAVERLIPTDEQGPGACAAGVTEYIDRQLASVWGVHGRNYRFGPWQDGTPQQGYQSALVPQQVYRMGIQEVDAWCRGEHRQPFSFLDETAQENILTQLEKGAVGLPNVPPRLFFDMLYGNTMEGFFSDPVYGGNRDKIGWKLLGFPGIASAAYVEHMARHGVAYRVEPVAIEDVLQGRVEIDAGGYPKHVLPER